MILRMVSMALVAWFPLAVLAQGSPGLYTGQVPNASQWNSFFAGKADTTNPVLTGTVTAQGVTVNPFPASEAPAYTAGNTSNLLVNSSSHGLAEMWSNIFSTPGTTHDGISGMARSIPTTTATQVNGTAGYCDNANPNNITNPVGVCVATGAYTVNRVDGAMSWMFNGVATDVGGSGGVGRAMLSELDYKPAFANTQVRGLLVILDSAVQQSDADAFVSASLWNGSTKLARWKSGFRSLDGGANTAFLAGMANAYTTAASNSQPIALAASDSTGLQHQVRLTAIGNTTQLLLDSSDGAGVTLIVPNNGAVNTQIVQLGTGYNVSSLPTCNAGRAGMLVMAKDATAPTYNTTLTGGGSIVIPAFCNGAAWTAH